MASTATVPFDPFTQSITLLLPDGETPVTISIPDLDDKYLYSLRVVINYSAQLGASLVLLLVLALLAKPEKRRSPIFLLNLLSLSLNVIRMLLQCLYFTGGFAETYAYVAHDYSRVGDSEYANQVAGVVLNLCLLILIETSLILQVRAISSTLRLLLRRIIFSISTAIVGLAIGFRFVLCVENSRYILSLSATMDLVWLQSVSNITTTISICWFCAVFVTRLGVAINERRKLGIRRWGPMHVVFIMGCQTLVIPAIFSIIQYSTTIPAMSSNVLTLVCIFLPLSSLWASSTTTTSAPRVKKQHTSPRPSVSAAGPSNSLRGSMRRKFLPSSSSSTAGLLLTNSDLAHDGNGQLERVAATNPSTVGHQTGNDIALVDLDLEKQGL